MSVTTFDEARVCIEAAFNSGASNTGPRLAQAIAHVAAYGEDLPECARLLIVASRYFYVLGKSIDGLKTARVAEAIARGTSDDLVVFDALLVRGVCAADMGAIPEAVEVYADALRIAVKCGSTLRQVKILLNIGVAISYVGLERDALRFYRTALSQQNSLDPQALEHADRVRIASIHTNMALASNNLGEFAEAFLALQLYWKTVPNPDSLVELLNCVISEGVACRTYLEQGNLAAARVHASRAREFADQSCSARAARVASMAEGLVAVFSGQAQLGLDILDAALSQAEESHGTSRQIKNAIVRANEHLHQNKEAIAMLQRILNEQTELQTKGALEILNTQDSGFQPIVEGDESVFREIKIHQEVLEGRIAKRENARLSQQVTAAKWIELEHLAVATEFRDDASGTHSYRVGRLASLLAKENGCDHETCLLIDIAARLHDVGKIGIPDSIVLKTGVLNAAERDAMKTHTTVGANLLQRSLLPNVQMAIDVTRHHHDWWNGSGASLAAGEGIPLAARIVALADVYDALTHERAYKRAWRHEDAMVAIRERRGIQFDPVLTDLFVEVMAGLAKQYDDLDVYLGSAAQDSTFLQARQAIADLLVR